MKKHLFQITAVLILLIGYSPSVFATAQIPDRIIHNGQEYSLNSNPLEGYFEKFPDKRPVGGIMSTALWRGYVATFEIKNSRLFLEDIEIEYEDITSMESDNIKFKSVINEVFPGQKEIILDWFTGLLVIPHGELVNYVHMGYGSTYEKYILLEIDKGYLKQEKNFKHKEYEKFKEKQFQAFKRTEEYEKIKTELQKNGDRDDEFIDAFIRNFVIEYTSKILTDYSVSTYTQKADTIKLSAFKLCELTIDKLRMDDPDLVQVEIKEMNLCPDGFVQDSRFENCIGYKSELYPGIIFQKYQSEDNAIAKIHLTDQFRGYLPDGIYVDLKVLKAADILQKYDSLNTWISRGCSDYFAIESNEQIYFYVKINKDKEPLFPVDENYYGQQLIEGIDIVADCYSYFEASDTTESPLFILNGKEVSKESLEMLDPDDIESLTVWKDQSAIFKYGDKGKNGVVEITLKKKNKGKKNNH